MSFRKAMLSTLAATVVLVASLSASFAAPLAPTSISLENEIIQVQHHGHGFGHIFVGHGGHHGGHGGGHDGGGHGAGHHGGGHGAGHHGGGHGGGHGGSHGGGHGSSHH